MNERETIELLEKGKVAWNQWAQDLLSQKAALEASGRWLMSFSTDGPKTYSTETTDWFAKALVDLQDHAFDKDADFSDLLFPGFTRFEGAQFRGSANFRRTRFVHFVRFMGATFREADFTGAEFAEAANFIDAKFLESAQFIDTRFAGRPAWFSRSEFRGLASFRRATFGGWGVLFDNAQFGEGAVLAEMTVTGLARFDRCTVEKQVEFSNSRFQGRAWFFGAQFKGATEFQQTTFEASATFRDASFNMVDFHGMDSKGAFSLEGVVFDAVPGFVQSHFSEAPLLDTIQIRQMQAKPGLLASGDKGVAARYRALRRLAVQGHDHEREMAFFAAEVRALRGDTDKPLPDLRNLFRRKQAGTSPLVCQGCARYWAGIFYEVFSDFGRSMSRPLLWWGALTWLFSILYLLIHVYRKANIAIFSWRSPAAFIGAVVDWFRVAMTWAIGAGPAAMFQCVGNRGSINEPFVAGIWLSVKRGLVFSGSSLDDKSSEAYGCLYGVVINAAGAAETPIVPYGVALLGIAQAILSAALVFLLLLGIRNQFRIR